MPETQKYLIQAMEDVAFFESDGSCMFLAGDIQEGSMTNEQEDVYATGKNGVRIGSSSRNKASRLSITNGSILEGALAAQVGAEVVTGDVIVRHMDLLTVASGKAKLTYKPQGATGAEIPFIYKRTSDGGLGTKYAISSVASETAFSYNASTNEITVPTKGVADGDQIVMWYDVKAKNAKRVSNFNDKFSAEGRMEATVLAKNVCDEKTYVGKIIYYRCKASGNFDLSFGSDFSVQKMEFEALSSSCLGASNLLWDFVIYDTEDIETVAGA